MKLAEREIYLDGKKIDASVRLPFWLENKLDIALDDFEDGNNAIENGYEVYSYGCFTIKRKCIF